MFELFSCISKKDNVSEATTEIEKVNSRTMKVLTGTEKRESSRCATLLLDEDAPRCATPLLDCAPRSPTLLLLELELAAGA